MSITVLDNTDRKELDGAINALKVDVAAINRRLDDIEGSPQPPSPGLPVGSYPIDYVESGKVFKILPKVYADGTAYPLAPAVGGPLIGKAKNNLDIGAWQTTNPSLNTEPGLMIEALPLGLEKVTPDTLQSKLVRDARLLLSASDRYKPFVIDQPGIRLYGERESAGNPLAIIHQELDGLTDENSRAVRMLADDCQIHGLHCRGGFYTIELRGNYNLVRNCIVEGHGTTTKEAIQAGWKAEKTGVNVHYCVASHCNDGISLQTQRGSIRHCAIHHAVDNAIELDLSHEVIVVGNRTWKTGQSILSIQGEGTGGPDKLGPFVIEFNQFCGHQDRIGDIVGEPIKLRTGPIRIIFRHNTLLGNGVCKNADWWFHPDGETTDNVIVNPVEWFDNHGVSKFLPHRELNRNAYDIKKLFNGKPMLYNYDRMLDIDQLHKQERELYGMLIEI